MILGVGNTGLPRFEAGIHMLNTEHVFDDMGDEKTCQVLYQILFRGRTRLTATDDSL